MSDDEPINGDALYLEELDAEIELMRKIPQPSEDDKRYLRQLVGIRLLYRSYQRTTKWMKDEKKYPSVTYLAAVKPMAFYPLAGAIFLGLSNFFVSDSRQAFLELMGLPINIFESLPTYSAWLVPLLIITGIINLHKSED